MQRIVTITFSPCIDKSTNIPSLIPEKKIKCSSPKLEPGGGGVNVARAIKKLGGEAVAIFPSGGYTGKYFNQLLQNESVETIIIESKKEPRENIIIYDESTGNQYRFGMPGTELFQNEWEQCIEALKQLKDLQFIIASGSLPPGVPDDIYARIARIASSRGAKFIVDTSGEALRHAADETVYLLKPNLNELSTLTGIKDININNVESIARNYFLYASCEILVVSLGQSGALLFSKNQAYKVSCPPTTCKSTVGAGDSMVAGLVMGLSNGMSLKESLQYAVACGTAATLISGTGLCRLEDVLKLFRGIKNYSGAKNYL